MGSNRSPSVFTFLNVLVLTATAHAQLCGNPPDQPDPGTGRPRPICPIENTNVGGWPVLFVWDPDDSTGFPRYGEMWQLSANDTDGAGGAFQHRIAWWADPITICLHVGNSGGAVRRERCRGRRRCLPG